MRRRRRRWPLITLIVIIVLLVVADRGAKAYTENQMASQVQSSLGLSGKPHVTIQGFPFLTQLAARDFRTVDVNASNETITASSAGSGLLEIASLTATLHGMHIHGLNSATVDQFNASALITFTALGNVGGIPQGITLSADGPNQIKADISLGPLSDSAVAQVTRTGSNQINVKVIDAGGIPIDLLGNLANFNITIPKLPARSDDPEHQRHPAGAPDRRRRPEHHAEPVTGQYPQHGFEVAASGQPSAEVAPGGRRRGSRARH